MLEAARLSDDEPELTSSLKNGSSRLSRWLFLQPLQPDAYG